MHKKNCDDQGFMIWASSPCSCLTVINSDKDPPPPSFKNVHVCFLLGVTPKILTKNWTFQSPLRQEAPGLKDGQRHSRKLSQEVPGHSVRRCQGTRSGSTRALGQEVPEHSVRRCQGTQSERTRAFRQEVPEHDLVDHIALFSCVVPENICTLIASFYTDINSLLEQRHSKEKLVPLPLAVIL